MNNFQKKIEDPAALQEIGSRIYVRRKELGVGQVALSEQSGVSNGYISKIENGKVPVYYDVLQSLAKPLGVSVDFLVHGVTGSEVERGSGGAYPAGPGLGGGMVFESVMEASAPFRSRSLRGVNPGELVSVPMVSEVQAAAYDPCVMDLQEFVDSVDGAVLECAPSARYVALLAVMVRNTSLCPEYPPGSVLYVDGGQLPQRGDLVIARLEDEEDLVAKYYHRRNNVVTLTSGNSSGRSFEVDLKKEPDRIVYMFPVLEERVDLRKRREWEARMGR